MNNKRKAEISIEELDSEQQNRPSDEKNLLNLIEDDLTPAHTQISQTPRKKIKRNETNNIISIENNDNTGRTVSTGGIFSFDSLLEYFQKLDVTPKAPPSSPNLSHSSSEDENK